MNGKVRTDGSDELVPQRIELIMPDHPETAGYGGQREKIGKSYECEKGHDIVP